MPFQTIDSFERSSLDYYEGAVGEFSIVSDRATDGSNSLFAPPAHSTVYAEEGGGISHVPEPGDLIRFDYYYTGTDTYSYLFLAHQDNSNQIRLEISPSSLYAAAISGGTWNDFFWTGSGSVPSGQWLTFEVDYVALDELGVRVLDTDGNELIGSSGTSATPAPEPPTNTFGFSTGSTIQDRWFDNLRYEVESVGLSDSGEITISAATSSSSSETLYNEVTGQVTLQGSPVEGATVIGINDSTQEHQDTVTTDSNGEYTIYYPSGDVAHLKVQYDDGSEQYNTQSKPFIVTE